VPSTTRAPASVHAVPTKPEAAKRCKKGSTVETKAEAIVARDKCPKLSLSASILSVKLVGLGMFGVGVELCMCDTGAGFRHVLTTHV